MPSLLNRRDVLFICLLAYSLALGAYSSDPLYRVAFVFAGSARSFVVPPIHESLRQNLILAFCPPDTCYSDVFVRVSTSDNNHQGADAVGVLSHGTDDVLSKIGKALQRLQPLRGKLILDGCNIGSREEAEQMDVFTKKSFWQRVYRLLDPRRYSMYFHRYMAYQMAVKEEEKTGIKYTWVVHARLDMGWGQPIQPVHAWSMKRMWVSDGWFADVPDTFALLPRDLSDGFYSLDEYYEYRDSICLGGPNFDPKTTTPEALAKLGFNPEETKLVISDLCLNKHAHDSVIVYEKATNITWTHAGTSETILKRKLKRIGVEYDSNRGRLGYTTFFTFMVRHPLNFICFYLEQGYFIPWAKEYHHTSAAVAPGCNLMMTSFNLLHDTHYSTCDSNFKALERPTQPSSSSSLFSNTLGNRHFNFMPFRLRHKGKCLALPIGEANWRNREGPEIVLHKLRNTNLETQSCIDNHMRGEFNNDYNFLQLFALFPLWKDPQKIVHWDGQFRQKCLTVMKPIAPVVAGNNKVVSPPSSTASVTMGPCEQPRSSQAIHQLFTVRFVVEDEAGVAHVYSEPTPYPYNIPPPAPTAPTEGGSAGTQRNHRGTKTTKGLVSEELWRPILPPKVAIILQWAGGEGDECLSIRRNSNTGTTSTTSSSQGDKDDGLGGIGVLQKCFLPSSNTSALPIVRKSSLFILERTYIKGPTA